MSQLIYAIIFTVCFSVAIYAEDRPMAFLKVEYQDIATEKIFKDGDSLIVNHRCILQIADKQSFYYDPQKIFIDSLRSTPQGRETYKALTDKAYYMSGDLFENRRAVGIGPGKTKMILKDFNSLRNEVWDSALGDKYHYYVPMKELSWEIADSTRTVLNYECQMATADYHGRKWEAWFCPDIPVQDGPWQLCGLPGLIMEAKTLDNMFGFIITGIQECNEPLKEPFMQDKYFNSKRKAFLKIKKHGLDTLAASISARTGGIVKYDPNNVSGWCDLIETDYLE